MRGAIRSGANNGAWVYSILWVFSVSRLLCPFFGFEVVDVDEIHLGEGLIVAPPDGD